MADVYHKLGDGEVATDLVSQAATLAGNNAGLLQLVARSQVRVGQFAEAYETIHRLPEEGGYRVLPLVELAAAAAKREAEK